MAGGSSDLDRLIAAVRVEHPDGSVARLVSEFERERDLRAKAIVALRILGARVVGLESSADLREFGERFGDLIADIARGEVRLSLRDEDEEERAYLAALPERLRSSCTHRPRERTPLERETGLLTVAEHHLPKNPAEALEIASRISHANVLFRARWIRCTALAALDRADDARDDATELARTWLAASASSDVRGAVAATELATLLETLGGETRELALQIRATPEPEIVFPEGDVF